MDISFIAVAAAPVVFFIMYKLKKHARHENDLTPYIVKLNKQKAAIEVRKKGIL
jgi:hypothetical protein